MSKVVQSYAFELSLNRGRAVSPLDTHSGEFYFKFIFIFLKVVSDEDTFKELVCTLHALPMCHRPLLSIRQFAFLQACAAFLQNSEGVTFSPDSFFTLHTLKKQVQTKYNCV